MTHANSDRWPAIVTGAGQGLGAGIAVALHKAGRPVVLVDIDRKRLNDCGRRLGDVDTPYLLRVADVRDREALRRVAQDCTDEFGGVGVLVNNAALTRAADLLTLSVEEWDDVLAVNLRSVLLGAQAVIPIMRRQGWGRIINVASVAGQRGGPQVQGPHYATSKAGIIGLTRYLAYELAPDGIAVNAIAPGPVETEQTRLAPPEKLRQVAGQIPLGRLGHVQEVGELVVYLASDTAGFIVGATLDINGGLIMR
jgi:3-oxoacyl-[acyl-carrier protein] reductase